MATRGLADFSVMGEPTESNSEGATRASQSRTAAARSRLRAQRRTPARPGLLFELALIGISYWIYSIIRNAVPEQAVVAQHNATMIWHVERAFGIGFERLVNTHVNSVGWLIVGMNYYYATLHFIVTIGVLVWLYRSHPGRYAGARTVLFITTGIALVGFYLFPLAPPRLSGFGFVDTVKIHHTWGSMASGAATEVSNQYAAMPSMHIGWSLWCGLTIFFLARRTWVRILGLVYPLATLTVIISTANHYWMDAVGGAACLAIGFAAARVVYHVWAFQLPQIPGGLPGRPVTVPAQWSHPVGAGR